MENDCPKPPNPVGIVLDEPQSFKLAQAVYSAVTGKTEKVAKSFSKSYLIDFNSLKQLHSKCEQACTQWHVLQKNSSVAVSHIDDNQETFSSFDRFNIYDKSKTAPVESVVYEFNVLIRIQGIEKPQNYKISVRIMSRLALMKRMEEDSLPPPLMRIFGRAAIVAEIEYVDYVIARNLLGMVESWANEVEQVSSWSWARYLQKFSHWFPRVFQFGILIVMAATLISLSDEVLKAGATPSEVGKWLIFSGACLWAFVQIASGIGSLVEDAIDSVVEISAIKLNLGDDRMFSRYGKRNLFKTLAAVGGLILILLQGVLSNILTSWFVKAFSFLPK